MESPYDTDSGAIYGGIGWRDRICKGPKKGMAECKTPKMRLPCIQPGKKIYDIKSKDSDRNGVIYPCEGYAAFKESKGS